MNPDIPLGGARRLRDARILLFVSRPIDVTGGGLLRLRGGDLPPVGGCQGGKKCPTAGRQAGDHRAGHRVKQ